MINPIIDCHTHLQDGSFTSDRDQVIQHALDLGITHLVVNATSPEDWDFVLELPDQYPAIIPCIGLHPWFINEVDDNWLELLEFKLTSSNAQIGEIGLDRWITPRDEELMEGVFREQLTLAHKLNRSATIHCIKAHAWLIEILKSQSIPETGILLHGFGGSAEIVKQLITFSDHIYFSFAGNVLDPSRKKSREAIKAVPDNRLLLETDAPYMIPPDEYVIRGEDPNGKSRNEPANLAHILPGIADILGIDQTDLTEQLFENAANFFPQNIKI
ncbi:putative deoxyribonuclease YjjV [Poriferisphaera corsica]|uniref:Putative deoxyribonuclease YjjV n=1 Tax=Poriferisphaera corsica TaxID=2528020 RepID=A0A517YXY6_9BACT|nr:TatD family hydrolase [Poriferisphaera corsica]QDU35076.1 putative deoxyribonuclease YjjV [Poriferisphaera corsica]